MKKIFVTVAILLWSANVLLSQAWQVTPHKMPYPVSGGQVVYDLAAQGNKIYILGGYSDSLQQTVDWIQEYNAELDSWKMVGHMLQPRKQFVADIWKGNSVYFGGAHDTSLTKTALETWNFNSAVTPSVLDANADFGRSFSTGHIVSDVLYLIGGSPYAGGKISYISSYNLVSKQVSMKYDFASDDKPREPMTFIVGENIYIFGGAFNGVIDKIQRFNIALQKIENLPDKLIEKRAGGSSIYFPQIRKGFLIGGYNETYPAMQTVEIVSVNSDGTLKISNAASLNYARYNPMAVNYKGTIAVFGGKDAKGKVVPYVEFLVVSYPSDVKNDGLPTEFKLEQNFPNPFNPSTTIKYQMPKAGYVSLKVYDILGREVATLVDEYKQAGIYNSKFSLNDSHASSGLYLAQFRAGNTIQTIKMMLLK